VERAHDHDIVHVRVRPSWLRYSDYRPGAATVEERRAGEITVVSPDPGWPAAFERVRTVIVGALGPSALAVEHVGSTAVPGLWVKPIIDVELIVADSAAEDDYLTALVAVGFTLAIREPECEEHRLLEGTDPRSNVHVFSRDAVEPRRACAFRDWLQSHPEDRAAYGEHNGAAKRGFADVTSYNNAKAGLIYERIFAADSQHHHDPQPRPL
jgi:GrpB-like predicted nucleotidyltransferase (UPF0157 family)